MGEGSLAIVKMSEEGVCEVPAVVAAVMGEAAAVESAVVAAVVAESKLETAVVVVWDAWKSTVWLNPPALSLIDVNNMSVVGRRL